MKADKAGNNPLVIAIIDDLLDEDDPKSYIIDVTNHGCVSGTCSNLIYYKDTCEFYTKHKGDIWEMASERANEMGEKNLLQMIANLNGADSVGGVDQFENLMAWYGYEETIRKVAGMLNIEL